MSYTQLTREQRYQIYALKKADHRQAEMASIIGCHKSTISRELARNGGQRGYRPRQAQELARARKLRAHRPRIQSATWASVESLLLQQWSPEQISGRLKLEQHESVSHDRIYQHIYADKRAAHSSATSAVRRSARSATASVIAGGNFPRGARLMSAPVSWTQGGGSATGRLTPSSARTTAGPSSHWSSANRS